MGLLSRLSSHQPPPAPQAPEPLWRRSAFVSVTAGDEVAMVQKPGRVPVIVPSFALDFVHGCEQFRPLETHLAEHVEAQGWSTLQVASLQSWLPKLIEAGALVSSVEIHAQCRAHVAEKAAPPRIGAIGFPTGGERVEILTRALESFIANMRTHGRAADLLVADSSAQPRQRDAFRAGLGALARSHAVPLLYAGEEEKRRFAAALIERSGCAPEAVEFALFDPLGTGFTCGANRNAVLLHGAGRMICSVDDDVVCRLAAAPEPRASLALFSGCDPFARWLFADREAALAEARWTEADFLGLHEAMLGRELGALVSTDLDLEKANDEILRRMEETAPRVRATFTGHVGDPGIPSSAYYLYYDGANLERLTASAAHYRAVFPSRSVLTLTAGHAIGDASVSPGMAMGLDQRALFPPSFPVLHAEDFIFGATIWQCCPDAVLGHLPFAIAHEPAVGKPILLPSELSSEKRAVVFEFAHLMRRIILAQTMPRHATAEERMQTLGRALAEKGCLRAADFQDFLRTQIIEHESERLDYLERQLRKNPDAPDFWRSDVHALIEHSREALGYDDFDIPFDLKGARSAEENRRLMQTLIARYGALLQAWPAITAAAVALRDGGRALFVPVD